MLGLASQAAAPAPSTARRTYRTVEGNPGAFYTGRRQIGEDVGLGLAWTSGRFTGSQERPRGGRGEEVAVVRGVEGQANRAVCRELIYIFERS